ncbi:chromosomal replication initiator protein DNAa [Anaeramoeba ignava]|uniref:Chromosomal replication initiator protein DNAa n=1 Tax=Anaeramoeba ignava TaxID=1746090 RepID=A0A9Q0LJT5_ANAIG|nr:chromosomal replication initiator protein DNAa [Anaeramoeba ignava]
MTQQAHLVQSKILAFLNTNQKGFEMKEINNLTQLLNTLDFGKTFHQVSLSENKYIFQETPLGDTFTIGYETGAESVNFFIPTTIPKPIFFDFHQTFKIRQYENNIHKIYPYYFWPQFHKSYVHFTNQLSESKKIDQNDPKMQIIQSEQISKEVPNLHENSFVEFKGFTKNPVIITDVISKIVEYAVSFLNYSALNNNTKIPGSIYIGVEETKNISRKPKNVYFAEKPNDLEEIFVDVSDLSIHLDPFIKNPKIQFHLRKKVQTKLANPQSIAESFWENNIQLLAFIWDDEEPDIQQPVYGLPISSQEKDDFLGYLKKLFFNGRCTVKVCQNKKIYRNYKPLSNNEFTQIIQVLKQNAKSKSVLVSKNKQMLIIENEKETDNFIKKRFIFWPTIPLANIKPFYQKIGDRYLFQFQFKPDLLFHFFGYPEIYLQEYHLNDRNRNYFEIMAKYFPQSFPNFAFIKKPDLKLPESIKMMIEEIDFQRNNFIYIYGPKNSGKTIVGQLVANKIREKYPQFIFHYFNCGDFSNINDIQRVFVAHLTHEYDYLGEKYSSEEIQEKFESLFSPNFPHLLFFDDFPEEGEFSNWNKLYRDLNFPQNIIVIGTSFIQDSIFENIYEIDLITATEQITEFYERHPFWLQVAQITKIDSNWK